MCKHIAAVLYGIGAMLDTKPELFFTLRDVKMKDLVSGAVKEQTSDLLRKAGQKSSKVMDASDLSEIFGIDMEESPTPEKARSKSKKKPAKKPAAKTKKTSARKVKKTKPGKKVTTTDKKVPRKKT